MSTSPLHRLIAGFEVPPPNLDGADRVWIERFRPWMEALARYHRHEVIGLHHVPAHGRALLVVNHSLATYDGALLGLAIHDATGRLPMGLGDNLIFRTPGLRRVASRVGIVPARPETGERLLEDERLVAVAPGGMREALRPSHERYRVRWARRKGFVRLALRLQTPVILAACPAADDLYTVYEAVWTKLAYKHLKVPLPLVRGLGPTAIPRPVKLTHYIAPPLVPPPLYEPRLEGQVDALHARFVATMQALLREEPAALAAAEGEEPKHEQHAPEAGPRV